MPTRSTAVQRGIALASGLGALVVLWLFLHPRNASMANGALGGGAAVILLLLLAWARGGRESATSVERSASGLADERDRAIERHALAIAGVGGFAWLTAATIAVGVGAPAVPVLAIALWAQILTLIAGYLWAARRH